MISKPKPEKPKVTQYTVTDGVLQVPKEPEREKNPLKELWKRITSNPNEGQ